MGAKGLTLGCGASAAREKGPLTNWRRVAIVSVSRGHSVRSSGWFGCWSPAWRETTLADSLRVLLGYGVFPMLLVWE